MSDDPLKLDGLTFTIGQSIRVGAAPDAPATPWSPPNYMPVGSCVIKDDERIACGTVLTEECGAGFVRRLIIWRTGTHWMDWEVHETSMAESEGGARLFGDVMKPSKEPCAASLLMDGMIKWDGCTQWSSVEGWHYDGFANVPDVRDIIRQVRELAAEHMPEWGP